MINIKNGDLLRSSCDIICHQVNCAGVMGAGLARQIKSKFPEVYDYYKFRCTNNPKNKLLGTIDVVSINEESHKKIINLYAQLNYGKIGIYTNYDALKTCLFKVKAYADWYGKTNIRIGLPYNLGCGLAGGDWNIVFNIIKEIFENVSYTIEIWKLD